MRQITLIRHAKVDIDDSLSLSYSSLKNWLDEYDKADILADSLPSKEALNIAKNADVIITSKLKRTIASAKILGVDIDEKDTIFNEAKVLDMDIPFLKFTPMKWLLILRIISLFPFGKSHDILKTTKLQAKKSAKKLTIFSDRHESVVLVGHGGMNWMIRQVLLKDGWRLENSASNKNWGLTQLVK